MDAESGELLAKYPVVIEIPVWWGDQDAFGHVNNTVFLRWMESSRIAYTSRLRFQELYRTEKKGPILASVTCNFRRQLSFPDTVKVGARIDRIGRTSFSMSHLIVSRVSGEVAADGSSTIVFYDYQAGQPIPVSDEIRAQVAALEGRSV
ncbi:MAG TPA: thioesterase family protein [Isosphaeraceae bacterium]|nr:thioesterase family protein [Isosphaeraceae bacterium]